MMTNFKFEQHLLDRFPLLADTIKGAPSKYRELLQEVSELLDVEVYVSLMDSLTREATLGFHRFYTISLRKHLPGCDALPFDNDAECVRGNMLLQMLYIICLQHYFS
jgi:hypothetical protein